MLNGLINLLHWLYYNEYIDWKFRIEFIAATLFECIIE